jgi:hypothetical protein
MARIRQGNPGTQNVGDGSGEATLPPAAEPYRGELVSIASALSFNNPSAIQGRWKEFCTKVFTGGGSADINSIVQFVLRQSYVQTNKDLQFHADKVRYFKDVKEAIRDHLNMVREQYADFTSFCRANNIDPEKDPEPGTNQEQLLADWYAENVVYTIPGLTELLRDGAYDASVEGQVNAADAAVLDHFGEPPLPEEIKEVLLDAFTAYHNSGPPPDPSVLTAAFTELGIYITYRGDMADCDDLHHISTPGSMTDFRLAATFPRVTSQPWKRPSSSLHTRSTVPATRLTSWCWPCPRPTNPGVMRSSPAMSTTRTSLSTASIPTVLIRPT